ncbi:MAG TPA: F420-0:Gamma-glutamyl ligase [Firmicutes bacterium]|nr:F420-0:Gamma-glutamyl ligase [Bacillota bacterium]
MLRSPVFKERAALGIFCGLVDFFSEIGRRPALAGVDKIPIRTHVISENDDIVEVVGHYVRDIVRPGDLICVAESVVAITQGRAVLPKDVRPSILANFLCKFPGKDGSLATPPAMQLAIQEVGAPRVVLGSVAAGLGRLIGRKGDFYRIAGRSLALIDDIAGTMPPFDKHVILGPAHPEQVASKIRDVTQTHALIADVNDKGCVDVLACTAPVPAEVIELVLSDNPFGNDDQQTPIVIVRGLLTGEGGPAKG